MEKILEINEVFSVAKPGETWNSFDGFQIKTDKQTILLLISNSQSCCEYWGYFISNDTFQDFIGSELKEITLTDNSLNTKKLPEYGLDEGDCMFINIETSNGTLQFTAYNSHNGYYGHEAVVISTQLNHEVYL